MEPPKRRVSEICYIFRSGFQIYSGGQNNTSTEARKLELEGIVNGTLLVHLVTYCFWVEPVVKILTFLFPWKAARLLRVASNLLMPWQNLLGIPQNLTVSYGGCT